MFENKINKFAKVLVNYSLNIKPGDVLAIESNTITEPLMKEVYKEALITGGNPIMMPVIDGANELLFKYASDEQLCFVDPVRKHMIESFDAMLTIWGEQNTKSLSNIPPSKISLRSKSKSHVMKTYMDRMGKGDLKWSGTQFPTYSAAMDANMSLMEYEEFVFNACYLNCDDPVSKWNEIHEYQENYVQYLNTKTDFCVKSKDTNLTFTTNGRKWVNCDGKLNMPDGEIYTSPVENSMNGQVRFSFPAVYMSREVEDIVLTFKDGKVINASAKKGEDFLRHILDTDEGARFVGEFAIGTNNNISKFTKNILFDEKLGGTIHIAIGSGFSEIGGKNVSAIHWDLISDMKDSGEIYADNELFYKNGKFVK